MAVQNMKLIIEPLTWLHVGNGEKADPFGMIVKDGFAIYLNTNAYIRHLLQTRTAEFTNLVKTANLQNLMSYMYANFDSSHPELWDTRLPVDAEVEKHYKKDLESGDNQCLIYQFYRNAFRQAFLPGSSIKGCLRTAILDALYEKNTSARRDNNLDASLLRYFRDGRSDITLDPFKFIKITDAPIPDERMTLKPMQPHNVKSPASGIGNLNLLHEVVKPLPGKRLKAEFSVNMDFFENPAIASLIDKSAGKPLQQLCQIINAFYQRKMTDDLAALRGSQHYTIHTAAQQAFNHPANGYQFVIKLGKGSGRHYISYKQTNLNMPKTRNLIERQAVGWCRVFIGQ
jgi:hypothetical protein